LLELVVVISILAILAALAAPRYTLAIQRYRLEMAANRVAADIRLAKSYARAKGSTATISFAISNSSYSIAGLTSTERRGEAFGVDLSRDPFGVSIQSADFAGTNTLTIKGFGTPSSGGTVLLRLGDQTKTISVSADSGEVSVQ
jgi:type IV fimbrial biogenesis protein FimT